MVPRRRPVRVASEKTPNPETAIQTAILRYFELSRAVGWVMRANAGRQLVPEQRSPVTGEITKKARAIQLAPAGTSDLIGFLVNGDMAYPEMLAAIRGATRRVWLLTYSFETNAKGREFVDALAEASQRGVDVRVAIDRYGSVRAIPPEFWEGLRRDLDEQAAAIMLLLLLVCLVWRILLVNFIV